jgi:hypothetical protein
LRPLARLLAGVLASTALAAAAQNTNQLPVPGAGTRFDEQQEKLDWKEIEVAPPPYPTDAELIEFQVSSGATFRFFIDAASLSVGADGVVRYTLVARSPSGVANISYEGIRCTTKSYRVYAQGTGGRWSPRQGDWRDIEARTIQRWHNVLYAEYLCPRNRPIQTAAEGVNALRRGIHPMLMVPINGVNR